MLNPELPQPELPQETEAQRPYVNVKALYDACLDSYTEYWNDELSLAQNVLNIIKQSVLVPNGEVQYPIMAAYTLLPTNLSAVLPIAFSYGCRGSGKTTASILATKIRGVHHIFSPGDTFASSRNLITKMRFFDEAREHDKPGCIMAWDNLNEDILSNSPQLYNVILAGYNRQSATVRIADKGGENIEFDVFCPKWFSSVSPLHQVARFNELARRIILFVHKPLDQFSEHELSQLQYTPDDLIDVDSVSWSGLGSEFQEFWLDEPNIMDYIRIRSSLTRKSSRKIKLPQGFDPAKRSMSIDMITTMVVTGLCEKPQDAIELLHAHYSWCDEVSSSSSVIADKIKAYIAETLASLIRENDALVKAGFEPNPLEISTASIHSQMSAWYRQGQIDVLPTVKNYRPALEMIGWVYTGDSFIKK